MCADTLADSDRAILEILDGRADFNPQALTAATVERLPKSVAAAQLRSSAGVYCVDRLR